MENADTKASNALEYLCRTDEEHAKARAEYNALSELRKTVLAFCYDQIQEGTVKDKEMAAYKHNDYIAHIESMKESEIKFHTLHNKRKRAELTIEMYRTYAANTRRGNI